MQMPPDFLNPVGSAPAVYHAGLQLPDDAKPSAGRFANRRPGGGDASGACAGQHASHAGAAWFLPDVPYRVTVIQNLQNTMSLTMPLNAAGFPYHLLTQDCCWVLVYARAKGLPEIREVVHMICFCDSVKVGGGRR